MVERDLFRITTQAIIFNEEDNILVLKYAHRDEWCFPGGHVDQGEQADEAIVREVREETGLDAIVLSPIDIHMHRDRCIIAFLVEKINSHITLSEEHTDYKWISIEELDIVNIIHKDMKRRARIALKIRKLRKSIYESK